MRAVLRVAASHLQGIQHKVAELHFIFAAVGTAPVNAASAGVVGTHGITA
jgi:hypothetical protein